MTGKKQNDGCWVDDRGKLIITSRSIGSPQHHSLCDVLTRESVDFALGAGVHVCGSLLQFGGSLTGKPRLVVFQFQLRRHFLMLTVQHVCVLQTYRETAVCDHPPSTRAHCMHLVVVQCCHLGKNEKLSETCLDEGL